MSTSTSYLNQENATIDVEKFTLVCKLYDDIRNVCTMMNQTLSLEFQINQQMHVIKLRVAKW